MPAPSYRASWSDADPTPYWLDDPARPPALAPLEGPASADLLVVGGGYLGLWSALVARERDPGRDVLVVEAGRCGEEASGRNGGFCEASLTHGFGNGYARWPGDLPTLLAMGEENLEEIERTIARHGIDCDFLRVGALAVATREHEVEGLHEERLKLRRLGRDYAWLDRDEVRSRVDSPTFLAAYHDPGSAIVEPARLAWGLRQACLDAGVRIAEHTRATGLAARGAGVAVATSGGEVVAGQVVLATNAFPPLLRRLRLMTVPVYDYVLMTEPLTQSQRAGIGWSGREGFSNAGNQFVYSRTTRDGRILWGGHDAVYHFGSAIDPAYDQRPETFETLARTFFETFPQLEGLRFSHAWSGIIDTSTRFTAFYGQALGGRVGYALGFTGLGVGATRWAAQVLLDLLAGSDTPRTRLDLVRSRPRPFPPEPVRWLGIEATTRSLVAADRTGRENLWLRAMTKLGLGFDS